MHYLVDDSDGDGVVGRTTAAGVVGGDKATTTGKKQSVKKWSFNFCQPKKEIPGPSPWEK